MFTPWLEVLEYAKLHRPVLAFLQDGNGVRCFSNPLSALAQAASKAIWAEARRGTDIWPQLAETFLNCVVISANLRKFGPQARGHVQVQQPGVLRPLRGDS